MQVGNRAGCHSSALIHSVQSARVITRAIKFYTLARHGWTATYVVSQTQYNSGNGAQMQKNKTKNNKSSSSKPYVPTESLNGCSSESFLGSEEPPHLLQHLSALENLQCSSPDQPWCIQSWSFNFCGSKVTSSNDIPPSRTSRNSRSHATRNESCPFQPLCRRASC